MKDKESQGGVGHSNEGHRHDESSHKSAPKKGIDRRNFVKTVGLGGIGATTGETGSAALLRKTPSSGESLESQTNDSWPTLRSYDQDHLHRIALPTGGIGTGTISLGGRGDLRDWEIMNRPAKGFVPKRGEAGPFFVLFLEDSGRKTTRLLEGPVEVSEFEGSHGSETPNENLPRFRSCSFDAAYPFGRVTLSDPDLPVDIQLKAFNPLIPGDADKSGIPVAILTYSVFNRSKAKLRASICGNLPNFVGIDGWEYRRDWKGDPVPVGAKDNQNEFRSDSRVKGIFLSSKGVAPEAASWGSLSLCTTSSLPHTYRTSWIKERWGTSWLDYWDDFSSDGRLDPREDSGNVTPMASLAAELEIPAGTKEEVTFLITWHFPNRYTWTPDRNAPAEEGIIGNYYTTQYSDAWDVAVQVAPQLGDLQQETANFVDTFCSSSLPEVVKESALFNLSTLRSQTCFRTADGRFFGFEGTADSKGCCHGSCTHVWNYELATHFLFGELASSMRETEFGLATNDEGLMSFRVNLPLQRSQEFGKAAADGQMGCIMKMYRDWQLSGDKALLKKLWPKVKKALEFCWIEGGWDADRDGVMEGCQHNTMDVEYYGPNPQMGIWYLGALRAAEEMARSLEDEGFADECRALFESGSRWIDENLFNGEYYEQQVQPIPDRSSISPSLLVGMGASDPSNPDYQLDSGCLVDQLVGQFLAHACGLGYLVKPENVQATLKSIKRFNQRTSLHDHFNCMRTFALDGEAGLLMASYPHGRPANPFPYFTEIMTGFEYTAAVGMLYEGLSDDGIECIRDIRARYDGQRRSPFDEAECGHHYARAMASWGAVLALSGFDYSGVDGTMVFGSKPGNFFWSNGYSCGQCALSTQGDVASVELSVLQGYLTLSRFTLSDFGTESFAPAKTIGKGQKIAFEVSRS
jgi:uncharacterized protein (DUF608 family)